MPDIADYKLLTNLQVDLKKDINCIRISPLHAARIVQLAFLTVTATFIFVFRTMDETFLFFIFIAIKMDIVKKLQ